MAKHLFNYCPMNLYEDKLKNSGKTLDDYIMKLKLDGIEQYVYELNRISKPYINQTVGVHLRYWPYWMDFWLDKNERMNKYFQDIKLKTEYFAGAKNTEEWISVIKANIHAALQAQPEYLVWHVAEATCEEAFTFKFNYSDREVLKAASDVFNAVADEIPDNIIVLFENLWWPGLKLINPYDVNYFFNRIKHKNIGIMLDTGHLMNTDNNLSDEDTAIDYVCSVIRNLGDQSTLIKGVHLSCSLSGAYQKTFPKSMPKDCDYSKIWKHITSIDQHKPFTTKEVQRILSCISPDYIVHELAYNDLDDMIDKVEMQLRQIK